MANFLAADLVMMIQRPHSTKCNQLVNKNDLSSVTPSSKTYLVIQAIFCSLQRARFHMHCAAWFSSIVAVVT